MDTWDGVHAGDVVLGHDGQTYGIVGAHAAPGGPVITLFRHGVITGPAQVPHGTPVTVLQRADNAAEARAFAVLAAAGLNPEVIGESHR
jgi:hypothetical protein